MSKNDKEFYPYKKKRNYSPDNKDVISQRIIQYIEDPKDSDALAEIKKLSQNAKNQNIPEKNNRFLVKNPETENRKLQFIRRRHQFKTQKYEPKNKNENLIDEIKSRMNEGKNDEDDDNNQNRRVYYEQKEDIRVNLKVENDNKPDRRKIKFNDENRNEVDGKKDNNKTNNKYHHSNLKKSDKKLEQNVNYEEKRSNLNRRNFSPDNNVSTSNRIVQYLDDPKESDALAEIKKISQKAKKQYSKNWDNIDNTTKNNRVAFKDVDNENRPVKTSNAPFERRKKNFSTQKYIVKNKKKNLIDELNERKQEKDNNKKDNENNQSKKENEITQRIIQYFEDPKDSSALAQVKKISQKAKNQK